VAGCCDCDDEPSGSCATELGSYRIIFIIMHTTALGFPVPQNPSISEALVNNSHYVQFSSHLL
jgi:hypothetical protein